LEWLHFALLSAGLGGGTVVFRDLRAGTSPYELFPRVYSVLMMLKWDPTSQGFSVELSFPLTKCNPSFLVPAHVYLVGQEPLPSQIVPPTGSVSLESLSKSPM
jgi:hypothetical protein